MTVSIGQFSVVGQNCIIGQNVIIMDNVSIQDNVSIGDNCVIYSGVRIYDSTFIGNDCILHSNCVIGSDGFGFAPNEKGEYIKTPQIGNVKIGGKIRVSRNGLREAICLHVLFKLIHASCHFLFKLFHTLFPLT